MNKEYIYKDGKTLIIDDNNNQTVIDFYDNLDKVLVQENLIETIEKEIENLEVEIFKYKNQNKFSMFLNKAGIPMLMTTLGVLVVFPIFNIICEINAFIDTLIFGTIRVGNLYGLIAFSILVIPNWLLGIGVFGAEMKREQKAKETQLECLKKEMKEQKKYLEELQKDKTVTKNTENFYVSKIDNDIELKDLRDFLKFCYILGYNEKEFFKYYQKGILEKHLEEITNDYGIEYANQYFEEKGPKLVKKKIK